jgi:hypothetical protein
MEMIKDILRQFWMNLVALVVLIAAVARYVQLGRWEQLLVPFAIAVFGFVCVIASEEVSDWTGRHGWNRQQWWQYPGTVVQAAGGIALVVATVVLYRS